MYRQDEKGFTLYELLITVAVAAIILSFGVPGFMDIIQNNRATTHTNDLVTALNLARSEATRRAATVTVCSSTNGATCNGTTDWSTGWVVRTATEVLRVWPERSGGDQVVTNTAHTTVAFDPRGALTAGPTTFSIEPAGCTGDRGRMVSVGAAGSIAVSRTNC
ncbi:MAG TPA: GspH/FimT family pseudopilin [Woeseiaceae bacterium]|nr:GspH/FimT family pseudopilin [Woeseiaceae bacterium]